MATAGPRHSWLIPTSVIIALVGGWFAGNLALKAVSLSGWLAPQAGDFSPQGLDLETVMG